MNYIFKKEKFHLLILSLFVPCFIFAQGYEWKVVESKIVFNIKNAGFIVAGTISGLNAKILMDDHSAFKHIEASVDSKTIQTNNSLRDEHIKEEDFLDVLKYMKISIKSIQLTKVKNGNYLGVFLLTIKNISKVISIPFSFIESNSEARIKGTFIFNRHDFEIGTSSFILSDQVTVTLELKLVKN